MPRPEATFQSKFIKWAREEGFKCVRNKLDATTGIGIPDYALFYKKFWCWLEFKKSENAPHRIGQDQNVAWAKKNSWGDFVYPENELDIKIKLLQFKAEQDGE